MIREQLETFKETARDAAASYVDTLDQSYMNSESKYDERIAQLNEELEAAAAELEKMKKSKVATYEALLKERQIQEQHKYYSVQLDKDAYHDIELLDGIKDRLIDGRPAKMVIWTTYYSKKVNEMCSRVLGAEKKCGIYKITERDSGRCYIGQAKDVKERFREHCKAGFCKIDTPASNKLYQVMTPTNPDNFTFELLEECSEKSLNERERYFIELYQAYDFGFNSTKGNK